VGLLLYLVAVSRDPRGCSRRDAILLHRAFQCFKKVDLVWILVDKGAELEPTAASRHDGCKGQALELSVFEIRST